MAGGEDIVRARIVLDTGNGSSNSGAGNAESRRKDQKEDIRHKETTGLLRGIGGRIAGLGLGLTTLATIAGAGAVASNVVEENTGYDPKAAFGDINSMAENALLFRKIFRSQEDVNEESKQLSDTLQNELGVQLNNTARDSHVSAEEMNGLLKIIDQLKAVNPKNSQIDGFFNTLIDNTNSAIDRVRELQRELNNIAGRKQQSRQVTFIDLATDRDSTNSAINATTGTSDRVRVPTAEEIATNSGATDFSSQSRLDLLNAINIAGGGA